MAGTEQIQYETYRDGILIDSGTLTRLLDEYEIDQDAIRASIIAARAELATATTSLAAANTQAQAASTTAQSLAALKALSTATLAHARANNGAWQALLPALKYIAQTLDTNGA